MDFGPNRHKTYSDHQRDVTDVVDRDGWDNAESWAITESLRYANLRERKQSPWKGLAFMDEFEAMLDVWLGDKLRFYTATPGYQRTKQAKLADGGLIEVADKCKEARR